MKRVPGRKTDVQDAEWLTDLLQHGLLPPRFVPDQPQHDLRALTRLRIHLLEDRTQLVNRIHKVWQPAGIKLAGVLSNIVGASGRASVQALCEGESDPERLAGLVHRSVAHKHEQLVEALRGDLREHHRFLLRELLILLDAQDPTIKHVEVEIENRLRSVEVTLSRVEAITGVSRHILHVLCAEIGIDLSRFPDAAHLASWAGMCPGQTESAGKRQSGRIRPGNTYVKSALVQAAHATLQTQTYLGEQYRRLRQRRGAKRAAVAVGHSILVIYYHMMTTGESYQEKGADFFQKQDQGRLEKQLAKRLVHLGYEVHKPLSAAPAV
jgi:transposase